MKFRSFREFRDNTLDGVIQYLRVDLTSSLRDLQVGLRKLSFGDNFESFEETVTIGAGQEAAIPNRLPVIPTRRVFVRHSGDPAVVDGDNAWSSEFVYLKNSGAGDATVTVVFMR